MKVHFVYACTWECILSIEIRSLLRQLLLDLALASGIMALRTWGFLYGISCSILHPKYWDLTQIFLRCLVAIFISLLPLFYYQYLAYSQYCVGAQRPWCPMKIFPFIQKVYWDNGFLRYWQVKQIPMFLLYLPMAYFTTRAIFKYAQSYPSIFFSAGISSSLGSNPQKDKTAQRMLPIVYLALALLLYLTFMHHVQVINRIMVAIPLTVWYGDRMFLWYCCLYSAMTAMLFGAYLPPA